MAKSALRLEAIRLREQGESVKTIAQKLGVSKSTASLWVRHVILSVGQLEKLTRSSIRGAELGRIKGALAQKVARLQMIENSNKYGEREIGSLSNRELDIAGTCLYWAEGTKKNRIVMLCNSDPLMIKLFIQWLNKIHEINTPELKCSIGINQAHARRESEVKEYWSSITNIPIVNFNKTSFKKYPLRKDFPNFNKHYGTLAVRVPRPARIFYKILGKIHAIANTAA